MLVSLITLIIIEDNLLEWIIFDFLRKLVHLHPLVIGDNALIHLCGNLISMVLHLLSNENEVDLPVTNILLFGLLLKGLACHGANPGAADADREVDRSLRPLEEKLRSIGEPDESLRSEKKLKCT